MSLPILISIGISILAYISAKQLIPGLKNMFLAANLAGIDMNKNTRTKMQVPEAMGVVTGCVLLVSLFLFIPVPFTKQLFQEKSFPHDEFVELIAALLSICCMILLGFADDVLNLRWRHKLLLPTVASLPLLMVYYINYGGTTVIMPKFIRSVVGYSLDIGIFYYIYMGMLAVFCTNAINILAGINGLEVAQSLVIGCSIITFNTIELLSNSSGRYHQFSLYFMLPYVATTLALWKYNKYPSQVFVGDTFNYLSGMTFAVVGILGHFSKTLLLFFIPQIVNFLYSVPQLFHFIPCPRHRLPKYNQETDLLECSQTQFKEQDLNVLGKFFFFLFKTLRLIQWKKNETDGVITTNNFTIINLGILVAGPIHEKRLNTLLICVQLICSLLAFTIRYPLAKYFYDA